MSRESVSRERVRRSLLAFGYLYEESDDGGRARKEHFYARILFALLLMALFTFFWYELASLARGNTLGNTYTQAGIVILGLVVGFIVGLTSVGSGALMTPILSLDFGNIVGKAFVVGTATSYGSISKLIVSVRNYYRKRLRLNYVFITAVTGVPTASIGAFFSKALVQSNLFNPLLGLTLLIIGFVIIAQARMEKLDIMVDPPMTRSLRIKGYLIGLVIGLIAGLTGVATGSLLVAALILLLRFPNRSAVSVALFEGSLILFAATITQLYLGNVNLQFTALLLLGGVPGMLIGNHYKETVNQRLLGYGIAGVILLEGARSLSQFFFRKSFFIF